MVVVVVVPGVVVVVPLVVVVVGGEFVVVVELDDGPEFDTGPVAGKESPGMVSPPAIASEAHVDGEAPGLGYCT